MRTNGPRVVVIVVQHHAVRREKLLQDFLVEEDFGQRGRLAHGVILPRQPESRPV